MRINYTVTFTLEDTSKKKYLRTLGSTASKGRSDETLPLISSNRVLPKYPIQLYQPDVV